MTAILPRPSTTISEVWRLPVRIAWLLLAAGCIVFSIIGTIDLIRSPLPICAGADPACSYNVPISQEDVDIAAEMGLPLSLLGLSLVFSVVARLSMASVGLIIFWRKSDDWVALVLAGSLMTVLLEGILPSGFLLILTNILFAAGIALFIVLPFVFPNGRFVPHQFRWVIVTLIVIYSIGYIFFTNVPAFSTISTVISLLWILMTFVAIPYRYFRVSNAVERQQTKWVAIGLLAMMVTASYYTIFIAFYPPSQPSQARVVANLINLPLYVLGYGFCSVSILMAMLRYRLWDVDIIIRRTLQYGLISTTLALVYFGSVVVVQTIVNGISGNTQSSQLTIALSTLLIAALFNPIRRRIQGFVDRRFFRRKYDAAQMLAQFAVAARDEVDMEHLSAALLDVVEQTMQPKQTSLWLRTSKGFKKK
jgi:hypothetical protein